MIATTLKNQDKKPEEEDSRDSFLANIHNCNKEVSYVCHLSQHIRSVQENLKIIDDQAEAELRDTEAAHESSLARREKSRRFLARVWNMQSVSIV